MKQVFAQWREISRDPKKLVEYQSRRKAILDEFALVREAEIREERARAAGIEKGIEVGIETNKIEDARKMLGKGMDIEMIAEVTGLSVAEVEAVRK
jgi:predicted transposase/invertase (TIGR01784 family)